MSEVPPEASAPASPLPAALPPTGSHPVQVIVSDDLKRSRLTIFFRGLLSFPHLIVLAVWGIAVALVKVVTWVVGSIKGRIPDGMHNFMASYTRYGAFVGAYRLYVANPFPPFGGSLGSYPPVDVILPAPADQSRLSIFFRPLLAIPAIFILLFWSIWALLLQVVAFVYALVLGRMHAGIQKRLANFIRYSTQVTAYRLRLTDVYPAVGDKG
jgi:uncharacterized protein DUF4389